MRHDLGARERTHGCVPLIFPSEFHREKARIPSRRSANLFIVIYILYTHISTIDYFPIVRISVLRATEEAAKVATVEEASGQ
jgi:hypothetical protein